MRACASTSARPAAPPPVILPAMAILEAPYEWAQRALRPLLHVAPGLPPKLRRGIDGRRDAVGVLRRWAHAERQPDRPLIWLHAPSVGEALMTRAILAALREERADAQFAFTFFSPSAERIAPRVDADVAAYLPWDVSADMRAALATLRPAVIAFVRTEIWPVLTREAHARGIPTTLVNAVLAEGSSRIRSPARWLLRSAYARLDAVGAVAEEDGARFALLGVDERRVHATGDARFDQVVARVRQLDRSAPLLRRLHTNDAFTVVAGSTWPADTERLLPAIALAREGGAVRLILAPHEPDEPHLAGAEATLRAHGIAVTRLSDLERGDGAGPPAILIDRVGVLADLYAIADVAYVGGGFGGDGLHSVVEPAALGVPVLFGPRHGNAREAAELAARGGGFDVRDAGELEAALLRLQRDEGARRRAGDLAAAYVESRRGGARRNARLILSLIPPL